MTIDIIGDNPRRSRYDPNLANEFNKQVEDEERKRLLDEKLGRTRPRESETIISAPSLDGFIYVPSIGIYIAKERTLNGKSWDEAIDEIYAKGINVGEKRAEMPTPFEFMTSLNYLLSGDIPNLPENEKESILDEYVYQRYETDEEFQRILEAVKEQKVRLAFYTGPTATNELGGGIEGENLYGRALMALVGTTY